MTSIVLMIAIAFFLGYLVGRLMHSVEAVSHRRARRHAQAASGTQPQPN